jgi:iron complex outermembrane receptor protein
VTSRDVRAPNLSELFAAPVTTTLPNFTNPFTGGALTVSAERGRQSEPEARDRQERRPSASVLSNPQWLPGFSASVDWYNIVLNGGISSLSAQQVVNFCFAGLTQFCSAFNFTPAQRHAVRQLPDVQPGLDQDQRLRH